MSIFPHYVVPVEISVRSVTLKREEKVDLLVWR